MRAIGYRTVDLLVDQLTDSDIPAMRRGSGEDLRRRLMAPASDEPRRWGELLDQLEHDVAPARAPGVRAGRAAQAHSRPGPPDARGGPRAHGPDVSRADQPTRSPWLAQLADDGPLQPLEADTSADVAVVGAGIAGVATAFFILRGTSHSVLLIERDRVARGATGRNAGQLTTYFERPLCDIADEFGAELAVEAQRGFDGADDLFDLMVAETGATVRVERFTGHMGMFNLHHLEVHLRNNLLRRQGGWRAEACVVSERAEFRDALPADFERLYDVVPHARVRELLDIDEDRYCAVMSSPKGSANSGLLSQQALAYLKRRYAGRFRFVDRTPVARIA